MVRRKAGRHKADTQPIFWRSPARAWATAALASG
jgi:hypothetical protein